MKLELVSFPTCPFVQRARMVLIEHGVPHELRWIDQSDKPSWFTAISPRGKVPVLLADGVPLFESMAICEFLDETTGAEPLMPSDPLGRARDRAWSAYAGEELLSGFYRVLVAPDRESLARRSGRLAGSLARLEPELRGRSWLSGDGTRFGMADVAMAPFFPRLAVLERAGAFSLLPGLEAVADWRARIMGRESLRASTPEGLAEALLAKAREAGAALSA